MGGSSVGHYMHLDHGPCGIDGPTDPVESEDRSSGFKAEIPRKCSTCRYLSFDTIFGFHCTKDRRKWGDHHRSLDWGTWEPEYIYLQLSLPKISTKQLSVYAKQNDLMAFIKEHRRINPGLSIEEAKRDFAHFREVLERQG